MNAFVRWLEGWFVSRHDKAKCFFVLTLALPVLLVFWLMQALALLDAEWHALYRSGMLRTGQILLSILLLILTLLMLHTWRRRHDPDRHPVLICALTLLLLLSTALLGVAYGYKDSPLVLFWLGFLFVCRALFGKKPAATGFIASLGVISCNETGLSLDWWEYAPLLQNPIYVGQPLQPWWDVWLRVLYDLAAIPLSALFFLLFHLLEREKRQLEYWVRTDALTGLTSRAAFMQQFEVECHRHARSGHSLCLLLCDIDHFKQVNDRWGHPAGDEVLAHLGSIMTHSIRPSVDVAARFGGEEFAILLPETDLQQATQVAEQIGTQLRAHVFQANSHSFQVTLSIGIAQSNDGDGELALRVADDNLYAAKRGGRDRVISAMAPAFAT